MARSKTPAPPAPKKSLSAEQIERGIKRLEDRITELTAFDVGTISGRSNELTALSAAIRDTLDRCFGEGSSAFQRLETATTLNWQPMMVSANYPLPQHYQENARANIDRSIALLREGQRTLREDLADEQAAPSPPRQTRPSSNQVFVVHGHDDAAKESLARFLEKLKLKAVILHEQPDAGRTIIEKFEECAGQVGFAVVLLTPDDVGSAKAETAQSARARQNVIFELGYFAGKLGRGRTCLLRKGDVEIPSDLYGVIYTELDGDGWKFKLVREMKAAGLPVDANDAF